MDKKVVVNKIINGKKQRVAFIKKESIKEIYLDLYYCDVLKTLVKIENIFTNNNNKYELELVDYEDIALDNFNRKLRDEDKIIGYVTLDHYIRSYAEDLVLKVNDSKIKETLISLYRGDSLKEKEGDIVKLYNQVNNYWTEQLINNKRK